MYFVEGVLEYKSIILIVVCVFFNLGLDVESGGLSERRSPDEGIFFDVYFGAPRGRHVQGLGEILVFVFVVIFENLG